MLARIASVADTLQSLFGERFDGTTPRSYASYGQLTQLSITQSSFQFWLYPFDAQVIEIAFDMSSYNITTCGNAFFDPADLPQDFIPLTSEWALSVKEEARSFKSADGLSCMVTIPIQRKFISYLIKDLSPSLIIVFGGLFGLFLDPSAPPLVGGRCTLMIVSMLLVVNGNAKLKRYPYMMWTDLLMTSQLAILLAALGETMIVHQHMRAGRKSHGFALDRTMRWFFPAVLALIVSFLVAWAMSDNLPMASLILLIGGGLLAVLSYKDFMAIFNHLTRQRRAVIEKIKVTTNKEESAALLEEAFELFDEDHSGALETDEAVKLVRAWNPNLTKKEAIASVESHELYGEMKMEQFKIMVNSMAQPSRVQKAATGKLVGRALLGAKKTANAQQKGTFLKALAHKSLISSATEEMRSKVFKEDTATSGVSKSGPLEAGIGSVQV